MQGFEPADYDHLKTIVGEASSVLFTPNVLTETSNLARHVADPLRSKIAYSLAYLIAASEEHFVSSKRAVLRRDYLRLGLTDAVLLELAASGAMLLTTDIGLYLAASKAGLNACNFNCLRGADA